MSDQDPMPTWWDPAWGETWPPSVPEPTSGLKRAAPDVSNPNKTPSVPAEAGASSSDGERRVRRREDIDAIVTQTSPEKVDGKLSMMRHSAHEDGNQPRKSGDPVKPELGVKMSRCWDITRDRIEKPPAEGTHKSQQANKKVTSASDKKEKS
ncbi:hypothetical protein FRC11_007129 [Ceratobasidium sp. 423]|nr:hypothetical protein FRC11_007129 [Ceratobasidium sp. 423]